jgi:hypothetical protein
MPDVITALLTVLGAQRTTCRDGFSLENSDRIEGRFVYIRTELYAGQQRLVVAILM